MTSPAAETPSPLVARVGLVAGPAVALAIAGFADLVPGEPAVTRTAAVACWMAIWWMTEAVPLAATALLPILLFPLLGIQPSGAVTREYAHPTIFLFLGGFLVALGMERTGLHRRVAMAILRVTGTAPVGLLLGFLVATALLSMGISNTATAMMMLPIVLAVIVSFESRAEPDVVRRLAPPLLLAVAYGASVGGIITLVGTPPNLAFAGILKNTFPDAPPMTFGRWFVFGLPLGIALLTATFFVLRRQLPAAAGLALSVETQSHAPMSRDEKVLLGVVLALAGLWTFRQPLELGVLRVPGWSDLLNERIARAIGDETVAMAMALLLFVAPSVKGGRLLDASVFARLPWGIVLLFGGGFALASGIDKSGLSGWLGGQLEALAGVPPLLIVIVVCLGVTFLTELTSNTATANVILPVLAVLAVAIEVDPLLLMIPGTIACSCAFMLPVATPPNAIVFGSERLPQATMMRTGFWLNLITAAIIVIMVRLLGPMLLGIDPTGTPDWAIN